MGKYLRPVANTILVQDVSYSMNDSISKSNGKSMTKLDMLKEANKALLMHKIKNCPKDLVGCVLYASTAEILFNLTNPANSWVSKKIDAMRLGSTTNMNAGINLAIKMLVQRPKKFLRNMILLTDGNSNHGTDRQLIELAKQAKQNRINIHTIGFGSNKRDFDEPLLKQIASTTHNGHYCHVWQLKELVQALIRFS